MKITPLLYNLYKNNNSNLNFQRKRTEEVKTYEKNGSTWELVYKNGLLRKSIKDGEVFKTYSYPKYKPRALTFRDGSKLDEGEFFNFNKTPSVLSVFDGSSRMIITKYNTPIHYDEPIIDIETRNNDGTARIKRITKTNGDKIKKFSSLKRVRGYFLNKYGINAYFDNIAQAYIAKNAIEDFFKFGVDRKAFSGLTIDTGSLYLDGIILDDKCADSKNEQEGNFIDSKEDFESGFDYKTQPIATFEFDTYKSLEKRKAVNPTIILNSDFDWSNARESQEVAIRGMSSSSTLKGNIQHELGHFLHTKTNLELFFKDTFPNLKYEQPIMSQVSDYAAVDPAEFVAEYIAGRMEGKKYPPKVVRLYKKYKGPKIFR